MCHSIQVALRKPEVARLAAIARSRSGLSGWGCDFITTFTKQRNIERSSDPIKKSYYDPSATGTESIIRSCLKTQKGSVCTDKKVESNYFNIF